MGSGLLAIYKIPIVDLKKWWCFFLFFCFLPWNFSVTCIFVKLTASVGDVRLSGLHFPTFYCICLVDQVSGTEVLRKLPFFLCKVFTDKCNKLQKVSFQDGLTWFKDGKSSNISNNSKSRYFGYNVGRGEESLKSLRLYFWFSLLAKLLYSHVRSTFHCGSLELSE